MSASIAVCGSTRGRAPQPSVGGRHAPRLGHARRGSPSRAAAKTKPEMQTFTEVDARKLLEAAESDALAGAWYLALSGLRRGEFCGLTWENVDLRPHW